MRAEDALIAAGFGKLSPSLHEAIAVARARNTSILAFTASVFDPLARQSTVNASLPAEDARATRLLAPLIVLAQALVAALGHR